MKEIMKRLFITYIVFYFCAALSAQADGSIKLIKFKDGIHHWNLEHPKRNYDRYDRTEIKAIADNFVNWQNYDGGWPKNIDWLAKLKKDSIRRKMQKIARRSTLDNRNTYPQIEYLSNAYIRTNNETYRASAEKGLNYILEIQNPSGGWKGWDIDAITYNDEIMTGVMNLFLDITEKNEKYNWISAELYKKICHSLDRAIEVTLKCQIIQNGEKTAWCQQHSHKTLRPMQARTFELRSITANESSDILIFLMRIKNPSKDVKEAIHAGLKWMKKSRIEGLKIEREPLPKGQYINNEYPYDLKEVKDPKAKPIWARFYDLDSNEPFLCNRDGKRVNHLKDVLPERRTGYEWYGYWPEIVFKQYAIWKKRKDVL
jgi:PelA/Pel-15E family pectate lyase